MSNFKSDCFLYTTTADGFVKVTLIGDSSDAYICIEDTLEEALDITLDSKDDLVEV